MCKKSTKRIRRKVKQGVKMASVEDLDELLATRELNGVNDGLYKEDIKTLKEELEQKNKEFDNYLETHKDYLSDEAEAIRKDIHRLINKIALLEKNMTKNGESAAKNADKMFEELGYKKYTNECNKFVI